MKEFKANACCSISFQKQLKFFLWDKECQDGEGSDAERSVHRRQLLFYSLYELFFLALYLLVCCFLGCRVWVSVGLFWFVSSRFSFIKVQFLPGLKLDLKSHTGFKLNSLESILTSAFTCYCGGFHSWYVSLERGKSYLCDNVTWYYSKQNPPPPRSTNPKMLTLCLWFKLRSVPLH